MNMRFVLCLLSLLVGFSASADVDFRAVAGYITNTTKTDSSSTTVTRQPTDLLLGYLWDNGWTVFGQYAMESDTNGSTTYNRTSYGPGFGYIQPDNYGVYFTAEYYLSSTYSTSGTSYTGSGYQVDLGMKIVNFSKDSYLVVGLSYEGFNYNKDNGTTTTYDQTQIDPRIGLLMSF